MNEKRFTLEQWTEESLYFSDGEFSAHMSIGFICEKVEKKLNEQQAIINQLNLAIDDLLSHTSCDEIKKENEQLRTQLLICQQSKNDNGGFQVWEVPPIPKGKRISFTTNNNGGDGV